MCVCVCVWTSNNSLFLYVMCYWIYLSDLLCSIQKWETFIVYVLRTITIQILENSFIAGFNSSCPPRTSQCVRVHVSVSVSADETLKTIQMKDISSQDTKAVLILLHIIIIIVVIIHYFFYFYFWMGFLFGQCFVSLGFFLNITTKYISHRLSEAKYTKLITVYTAIQFGRHSALSYDNRFYCQFKSK